MDPDVYMVISGNLFPPFAESLKMYKQWRIQQSRSDSGNRPSFITINGAHSGYINLHNNVSKGAM